MKNKKIMVSLILICFVGFLLFEYFGYSTYYPNNEEVNKINKEYSLHLPDVEWRYTQYERDFLFNKESKIVLSNHYECKLLEDCDMAITITVTKNDDFMNLTLPFVTDSYKTMIKESKVLHDNEVNIEIVTLNNGKFAGLNEDQYIPIYRITLEKNDILYKFEFDTNGVPCKEDLYNVTETKTHEDKLKIYFEFIEDVLHIEV